MAKEALRLRLRSCWVSKCLPFWAICLLYHSVWQWGWESQACRRGCAWGRALALFPLAGPSCLPLYPREPCLFICYYIRIGRSKAGGPSAATTLAAFFRLLLCFSFSFSSSLSFLDLQHLLQFYLSSALLQSPTLSLPHHLIYTVSTSVDERGLMSPGWWRLLCFGCCTRSSSYRGISWIALVGLSKF